MKFKNNNHQALFNNEAKRMIRHDNVKMAVLYLLTADFRLWNEAKRHIKRGNIDLDIPIGAFILCATPLQRAPWNAEWT